VAASKPGNACYRKIIGFLNSWYAVDILAAEQVPMTNKKSVVVTGASTGIGWAISKVLLARNFQVYGTVRKPADAARLRTEFGRDFFPLLLDVTDESAVRSAAEQVKERLGHATLAGLVNNAGIAVAGPLLHLPVAEYRHQLEINLVAPLLVDASFRSVVGDRPHPARPARPHREY
jgi:hypothetical protein